MKTTQLFGLIDIITLHQPGEIREASHNPQIDRRFEAFHALVNGLVLRRLLGLLSLRGRRFPTMRAWHDSHREVDQNRLWNELTLKASRMRSGPDELEGLARWVRGIGRDHEMGPMVQQAVGSLFADDYKANAQSWNAAVLLDTAVRSKSPVRSIRWAVSGEIRRAKELLGSKVDGDLAGVHGTGIALHNIVKGLEVMRQLYAQTDVRASLSAPIAARRCLFAPAVVLRQATGSGEVGGCPFKRGTLFMLGLAEASKHENEEDMIFMAGTWSRCPAEKWVPALLEGIWNRATKQPQ